MTKLEFTVGDRIRIGKKFAIKNTAFKEGQIITLIEGVFEYDNGIYVEEEKAPSLWNEDTKEFDSVQHLFENDYSGFLDCEILEKIKFYVANAVDNSIIAYGDIKNKRKFKITFHDDMYFSHKLINRTYQPLGQSYCLETAINVCEIAI